MRAFVGAPTKALRKYMAEIGRRGGQRSKRKLTPRQARRMVAIREANRASAKKVRAS